jgi:hypothetical protein
MPAEELGELPRFETHARVFEQVTSFLGLLSTAAQIYIGVTGGLWLAVGGEQFLFSLPAKLAVLAFHLVASLVVGVMTFKIDATIDQRLDFLKRLGETYWPAIQAMGEAAAGKGKGRWRWGSLRTTARIWALVPLAGAAGSLVLSAVVVSLDRDRASACWSLGGELWAASNPVSLERSKYLLDKLGCDGADLPTRSPRPRAPVR